MNIQRLLPLVLILFFSFAHISFPQTKREVTLSTPPQFMDLGSDGTDSAVTMECKGESPFLTVSCTFTYVSVSKPTEKDLADSRNNLIRDLTSKTESQVLKEKDAVCQGWAKQQIGLNERIPGFTAGRAANARHGIELMKQFCSCQSKECVVNATLEQQNEDRDKCTIRSNSFSAGFTKVTDRKWVSNNGPEGICAVVSLYTIEHEANYDSLWTYSAKFVHTNKEPPSCNRLPESSYVYSWKSPTAVRLHCEEFSFSIWPQY